MHSPGRVKSPETTSGGGGVGGSGYHRVRTQTTESGDPNIGGNAGNTSTAVEMHDDVDDNLVIVDHHRRRSSHRASAKEYKYTEVEEEEDELDEPLSPSASQEQPQSPTPPPSPPKGPGVASTTKRMPSFRRGDSSVSATTNDLEMIAQTVSNAVASAVAAGQGGGGNKGYQQVNQQVPQSPSSAQQPPPPPSSSSSSPNKIGSSSGLHNRSRNNSWDPDDEDAGMMMDGAVLDDDLFEDDAVVRRYIRSRIPIVPAEFVHQPIHIRLWQGLQELRTAARQRRAARLLNDSQYTPTSHCILTWCCDATDRGIALVAILVLLWWVVGFIGNRSSAYWLLGLILFVIRVSARSTYESFWRGNHGAAGARKRSSPNTTSLPTTGTVVAVEMNDYRDHA